MASSGAFLILIGVMHQLRAGPEDVGHSIDPVTQRRVHQMGIALGRLHLRVTQQLADHFQRRAAADQQGDRHRGTRAGCNSVASNCSCAGRAEYF